MLPYAPLGDPRLDRFQQAVQAEIARLDGLIAALDTGAPPGTELVETLALSSGGVFAFTGLRGNDRGTLGYVLRFDLDAKGGGSTQYAVRINGDAGASAYQSAYSTMSNAGALATGAGDDTTDMILLNGSTASGRFCGTVTIPGSASGAARLVMAETAETNAGTVRGSFVRGAWLDTASELRSISLFADQADAGGVVSLYRMVR